jgi:peptidyl-tRNA hydrolase, PTH1 family
MRLIIGLGNPDKKYSNTRHNFGWLVLDSLADKKDLNWKSHKSSNSAIADFKTKREKNIIAKPLTYMNESGRAVKKLKSFYKIPTSKIVVIYDDIDLPFGKIRVSRKKSAGGHKGVESTIKHLKSKDFIRIRLGIGPQRGSAEEFVLKKFNTEQKKKLAEIIDTSHLILESIIKKGFTATSNKYN